MGLKTKIFFVNNILYNLNIKNKMDTNAPEIPTIDTIVDTVSQNSRPLPDGKFIRKMNAIGGKCSIDDFINVSVKRKKPPTENFVGKNKDIDDKNKECGWRCENCNTDLIYMKKEAQRVCPSCGSTSFFQEMSRNDMISQGYTPTTTYLYKRSNHFKTWLKRAQGSETTNIPDHVIAQIYEALRKQWIEHDMSKVNHLKIRQILKNLRLSKYYSHSVQITTIITGKRPPIMTENQQDMLLQMFERIQEPFNKIISGKARQNMLSYSFIIHKFLELLSWDKYLSYFPLLVSPDKIQIQDGIWKKICAEIGFEYIKSTF